MKSRLANFTDASVAMALQAGSAPTDALAPRLVAGAVLAAAALVVAYVGGLLFNLLVLAAAAVGAYEWNLLCNGGAAPTRAALGGAVLATVGIAALGAPEFALIALAPGVALAVAVAWATRARRLWSAIGLVYVVVPGIALIWLRDTLGLETIVWIFIVVWATDIGAYFAGRGLGGPRLAPRISPNKTWSGLVGGIACAAAAGAATAAFLGLSAPPMLALLSAVLAVVAQCCDLFESRVKRRVHDKDSGTLIPGHGGLLDRIDGLMAVAPAVAAATLLGGQEALAWR